MTLEVSNIVCPTCGSPDHMHHLVGANIGYWDMKCFNCNSYFNFDELYKHRKVIKPKTNGDRIRKMTDEELANWYFDKFFPCVPYCSILDECPEHDDCKICLLEWLKEEREE